MLAQTLPLVLRSLRVDSRDIRSHIMRGILALVVLLTLIAIQMQPWATAPGRDLFWWVCQYNYWGITFAATTFFATCITEEKEERTLSLLKMAGVGSGALLLGKWLPRLITAGLLILIQYPFTLLCITMGGLSWTQVSCAYISLLSHLFLVGNIGLLASVVCAFTNTAVSVTVVTLLLYHVIPWSLPTALRSIASGSWLGTLLGARLDDMVFLSDWLYITVGRAQLLEIVSSGYVPAFGFWLQVYGNLCVGLVLLLTSWLLFEPFTKNEILPTESIWTRRFRFALSSTAGRPWEWALHWKEFHYLAGGPLSVVLRVIAYLSISLFFWLLVNDFQVTNLKLDQFGDTLMIVSMVILWLEAGVLATRTFRTEMVEKTWSTLCMLPRSLPEIAYNKAAGAALALIPGIITFHIGALLDLDTVFDFFTKVVADEAFMPMVHVFVLQPLLAMHLATWISITLDWATWAGAMFLGAFVVFVLNFLLITCLESTRMVGNAEVFGVFFVINLFSTTLIVVLHGVIGARLSELRSQ